MFLQVLRYMKQILINFLKTKWRRRISRKKIRFFLHRLLGRTTTGRNSAPRRKNEKDSENISKNEVDIVDFFRKMASTLIEKTVFFFKILRCHFISIYISRIFLVFRSRCKIATGVVWPRRLSKKTDFWRDSAPPFCFKKIY